MKLPRAISVLLVALALGCPPEQAPPSQPPDESTAPADPIEHAQQLLEQGKPDQAQAVVEQALAERPDDAELWFSKGVAQRAQGQAEAAVQSWEQALSLDAELVAARHGIAAIRLEAGDYPAAIEAYVAILQLEPDFKDAHYNLGLALLAQGRTDEARAALRNAHRLDPEDPDVAVELGRLYALEGKLAEAVELIGPAAAKATDDPGIQSTYGWLLERLGRYAEAASAFETAVRLRPEDDDARLGLARSWLRTGTPEHVQQAATELEAIAGRRPDDPAVWLAWGSALGKLGQADAAVDKLDRAIELEPQLQSAHVQKIGSLVLAGRCAEAKQANTVLKRLRPSDRAKRAAKAALTPCR